MNMNILRNQIKEINSCKAENVLQEFPPINRSVVDNNIAEAQKDLKKMSLVLLKKLNRTKNEKEFNSFLKLYINTMSQLHKINKWD